MVSSRSPKASISVRVGILLPIHGSKFICFAYPCRNKQRGNYDSAILYGRIAQSAGGTALKMPTVRVRISMRLPISKMKCNGFAYWFWEPVERFDSDILDHLKQFIGG